jgi:hypothetical protein
MRTFSLNDIAFVSRIRMVLFPAPVRCFQSIIRLDLWKKMKKLVCKCSETVKGSFGSYYKNIVIIIKND